MSPTRPRVVYDTNIFIQYLLSPRGIAAECLKAVENRGVYLFTSKDTLAEIRDVLLRPHILSRFPDISSEYIEVFITYISDISTGVNPVPRSFRFERDPKDEIIIDLAIEAKANFIVTRDKDMLDLMTGYTDECKEFRQRFRELRIVNIEEFFTFLNKLT